MILIAESGSTKTDWVLVNDNNDINLFKTIGFNPFFHSTEFIAKEILSHRGFYDASKDVTHVYFYGAGCSSDKMNNIVRDGLSSIFKKSEVIVDHDLLACALATYQDEPSISCILGTGSNSCYYDGKVLREEVPAIAYVLGDEGSGSYYGKKLLKDYLYNNLPSEIRKALEDEFSISKASIFENVYTKPNANVYLASFMRFISNHYETDYVVKMVQAGMDEFMKVHVCCFPEHKHVKTHFIGSISKIFERELYQVANQNNIQVGDIIRKPVENLVKYHLRTLNLIS
jgi:N-acetylglucosamine kinase-like BadF-type ATPase